MLTWADIRRPAWLPTFSVQLYASVHLRKILGLYMYLRKYADLMCMHNLLNRSML